jgi:PAS domain S-box-containing protein
MEAEGFARSVIASAVEAIVPVNPTGEILSWNDAATRMYGFTAEEAVGKNISLVIPPDKLDEELKIRERLAHGERIDRYETVRQRSDGSAIEVSVSISPVRDASGQVVAAAGFARDISDQERYETQQLLAAIVESSDNAIVSMDLTGGILSWNDSATRMYGFTAEEAVGKNISLVVPPDKPDEELKIRERLAHGERISC